MLLDRNILELMLLDRMFKRDAMNRNTKYLPRSFSSTKNTYIKYMYTIQYTTCATLKFFAAEIQNNFNKIRIVFFICHSPQ